MNLKITAAFAVFAALGLGFAPEASASYMEKCKVLIADWDKCRESGSACKAEQKALEERCKCHKQKGDEWKLVMAAVGKDGVCAPEWIITPPADPSPPPHDRHDNQTGE